MRAVSVVNRQLSLALSGANASYSEAGVWVLRLSITKVMRWAWGWLLAMSSMKCAQSVLVLRSVASHSGAIPAVCEARRENHLGCVTWACRRTALKGRGDRAMMEIRRAALVRQQTDHRHKTPVLLRLPTHPWRDHSQPKSFR